MYKLKLYLLLFIFPFSFLLYHITSFEVGINAIISKKKQLVSLNKQKSKLKINIEKLNHRINLLNSKNPDLDLLEEMSFKILGHAEENTLQIVLDNQ